MAIIGTLMVALVAVIIAVLCCAVVAPVDWLVDVRGKADEAPEARG